MTTPYRGPSSEDLAHIPAELKARRQWVLWRGADRIDRKTGEITGLEKIPIDPQTLQGASTTDPTTWGPFEQCVKALPVSLKGWEHDNPGIYRGGGIGFVFSDEDPYVGVDLDKCRNPDTGALAPWAQAYINTLASYSEVTPSGTGLHALVQGTLPPHGRKKGKVEMYNYARFFTMTGWHVAETPRTIEARQDELTTVHTTVFGTPRTARQHTETTLRIEDAALLDKARVAKNGAGERFATLFAGDWAAYGSQSEADLALCIRLAFWTQDAAQLDRLFRQSGLMRDKWDAKRGEQTYGERTIREALARQTERYRPRQRQAQDTHRRRSGQTPDTDMPADDLQDTRPVIRISPDITRMVDKGQAALLKLPHGPVLFQRARRLSIIARGMKPPRWLHRPADAPVIVEAPAAYLDELATKAARWEKFDKRAKRGEEWVEVTPPTRFVKTLQARPSWLFPLLEGIIHSPTLRPDGSILDMPGYDPDTGLFFDSNGAKFPAIPQRPTLDKARSAIGRLQEVVRDFPFAEPWHFSAWLSAVLSIVCRCAIQGPVPLHGITATTRGSGKTLLADTIAIIGTGSPAARWSQVADEEEERKRLLSLALDGDPLICIDNVTAPLGSGTLALALTGTSFKDRLLGVNQTKEAPLSAVFLCTGNNVQYIGDVARRVLPIALDPKMEQPEERTGFQYSPLLPWVMKERPALTIAALTIVTAYFVAGCPSQGLTPFGSFEQWSDLIRQALVWAGEADPNESRKDIEAASNPEFERLDGLLHAWHACYDTKAATLKQAVQDIGLYAEQGQGKPGNKWNDLQDALSAFDERYDGKTLNRLAIGKYLPRFAGRVIDGMRLVSAGTDRTKTILWQVQKL
jgi:primase-polymerase (primpol)-like protein